MLILKSIIIGLLAILPGVSGSAIMISFGLYDKFFLSLEDIKSNKKFLLLFIFGLLIGVYIGSVSLIYIINFKTLLYYFIIGIMLSDLVLIIKKIRTSGKILYLVTVISFILSLITNLVTKLSFSNFNISIKMLVGGILFSFGKIFPGISSSFFLIILGIYKDILVIFAKPIVAFENIMYYLPFIIGTIIGILCFIRLLNYMIKNKYNLLYSIIIGFMISSIFTMVPKFSFNIENVVGLLLMIGSFTFFLRFNAKN